MIKPDQTRSSGFSLIELLVVISILALLVSLLLPSLRRAKEASRRIVCASNIRQQAMGLAAYRNDSKGKMPETLMELVTMPVALNGARYPGEMAINHDRYYNITTMSRYVGGIVLAEKKPQGIWRCPSHPRTEFDAALVNYWNTWQIMPAWYSYFGVVSRWTGSTSVSASVALAALTDHVLDSKRLLLADELFYSSSGGTWRYTHGRRGPNFHTDTGNPPDFAGVNQGWGDGSVAWIDRGMLETPGPFQIQAKGRPTIWVGGGSGVHSPPSRTYAFQTR